jgi:hypothetical protein
VFPAAARRGRDDRRQDGLDVVCSDTADGLRLLDRVRADGMPPGLRELGFRDTDDFWPPWCTIVDGTEIVSIAFTARRSPMGAEVGVVTPAAHRGRGLAAWATSVWAALPAHGERTLFYSTHPENSSSRRVVERLRLPLLGTGLSIS